jgi:hypothetical protein
VAVIGGNTAMGGEPLKVTSQGLFRLALVIKHRAHAGCRLGWCACGSRQIHLTRVQLATQTLCDVISSFQQAAIEVCRCIGGVDRINGDKHVGMIVPPRCSDEQHGAGAVQDELPVCVPEEGSKLRTVSGRVDNDEIGCHGDRRRTMAS